MYKKFGEYVMDSDLKIWGQGLIGDNSLTKVFWIWYEKRMARRWRVEYEGARYHLFSSGNIRQDIFVTDKDRYLFLDTIFDSLHFREPTSNYNHLLDARSAGEAN